MEIIQRGAEAVLYRDGSILVKERVKKNYRLNEIDDKIRKARTKREAKILEKLNFAPKIIEKDEKNMKIKMEFIDGDVLRDVIDDFDHKKREKICEAIGKQINEMHRNGIIHGDLTTSNMIIRASTYRPKKEEIIFIDFGLSFFSSRVEDRAVDLRLFRQALNSKHYIHAEKSFDAVLIGYENKEVINWLKEKVEKRGRYKRKNAM